MKGIPNSIFISSFGSKFFASHKRQKITLGDFISCVRGKKKGQKLQTQGMTNSWGKNYFIHGEYGAGKPGPSTMISKVGRNNESTYGFHHIK